jgi:tRNA A-37 threonylcarbamoyl transferase component Bud32
VPDDPDRSHDTDPLADTQTNEDGPSTSGASARMGPSAQRRSVRSGDTLGRYELVEDVGEGGMATVYRARDKELRREVAVKVLFPHLARREEVVRRFHREARAAAGLEHANILRVYDVGGADGDDPPYIVMELIRGHSLLGELERRGPLLSEVVACIGALLADALSVAHRAGIIHRDIKPANVMIDPGPRGEAGDSHHRARARLLLTDFGVARLETEDSLVTKTGALLGTPAYMSPEQASGDTATARSDLYSLGATLYQLSTGQLPYSGSPAKVMAQIAQGSLVSAVRKRSGVGPDLSRVIDRLMATEPTARPGSASDVASELRAIVSAGGFGEPAEELAAYLADPDAFVAARQPVIVRCVVAAARQALADDKLPRAMALADRASALAPDDPTVAELIAQITEGGRSARRRKILAILGGAVLAAGATTFGVVQLVGGDERRGANDVTMDAAVARSVDDARTAGELRDAEVIAAIADAGADIAGDAGHHLGQVRQVADAGIRPRPLDAGLAQRRDAGISAAISNDATAAAAVLPPDAAPVASSVDAAVAAGFIVVKNDTWCEVLIDERRVGRASPTSKPFPVDPGRHTVTCEQSATRKTWTQEIEVASGATVTATGSMLGVHEIALDIDATIDGTLYRRGQVARLKEGRHAIVVGGAKSWLDVRGPCTVRSTPVVGCY